MNKLQLTLLFAALLFSACKGTSQGETMVVKPRYHHSWYKNHIYKKKWRIGRIKFEPEKQGVKKVRMKS
ncbi:MAG: hypothetical protein N2044_00275 [Cyclobacteriaceae bacterium]|nr:hypothetical protein [Cyclobacteriaceae bacterium]MCX7636257.1 hypothetical protein [Cyclobacteriaceae bacterium]